MVRPMISAAPPAANGTINRIGFVGYSCAVIGFAVERTRQAARAARAARETRKRREIIEENSPVRFILASGIGRRSWLERAGRWHSASDRPTHLKLSIR